LELKERYKLKDAPIEEIDLELIERNFNELLG